MANSVYPDQLASEEANWSGCTLFAKQGISGFSRARIKFANGFDFFFRSALCMWFWWESTEYVFLQITPLVLYLLLYSEYSDTLTFVLLNPDIPCLCKQCRSRICTVCHLVYKFISTIWIKESDWLTIRSGHGIIIYSARQGLTTYHTCPKFWKKSTLLPAGVSKTY